MMVRYSSINHAKRCPFCALTSEHSNFFTNKYFPEQKNGFLILRETEYFLVVVDIAPIKEGHCLVVSKSHVLSVAELNLVELRELKSVLIWLGQLQEDIFGVSPIFFEHGSRGSGKCGGACIDHAHVHILPINNKLFSTINSNYPLVKMETIDELTKLDTSSGYIYYQEYRQPPHYALVDSIEKQYFRNIASSSINMMIWRWDEMLEDCKDLCLANILKTKLMVYDKFNSTVIF